MRDTSISLNLRYPHNVPVIIPSSSLPFLDSSSSHSDTFLAHSGRTPALFIVLGTNLLGLFVVALRRDIVYAVAATWCAISLWTGEYPKPAGVQISSITFTALYPLVLILSMIYHHFYSSNSQRRSRRIALPGDERALGRNGTDTSVIPGYDSRTGQTTGQSIETGPREVEEENWG